MEHAERKCSYLSLCLLFLFFFILCTFDESFISFLLLSFPHSISFFPLKRIANGSLTLLEPKKGWSVLETLMLIGVERRVSVDGCALTSVPLSTSIVWLAISQPSGSHTTSVLVGFFENGLLPPFNRENNGVPATECWT